MSNVECLKVEGLTVDKWFDCSEVFDCSKVVDCSQMLGCEVLSVDAIRFTSGVSCHQPSVYSRDFHQGPFRSDNNLPGTVEK